MKKLLVLTMVLSLTIPVVNAKNIFSKSVNNIKEENVISFTRTGNPDRDLENFAMANNISKKEAKAILYEMFGEPKRINEEDFERITRTKNPDRDLENFAMANNISKKEAKAILYEMFGEPEEPSADNNIQ